MRLAKPGCWERTQTFPCYIEQARAGCHREDLPRGGCAPSSPCVVVRRPGKEQLIADAMSRASSSGEFRKLILSLKTVFAYHTPGTC